MLSRARSLRLASVAFAAAALAVPAAARADGPFDPPVRLGGDGAWPSVAMTARGDAFVVWAPSAVLTDSGIATRAGVWMAWRVAGSGSWRGPSRIHDGTASGPSIAANDRGDVAVVWGPGRVSNDPTVPTPQAIHLRVFTAGVGWSEMETVPQPPLGPRRNNHAESSRVSIRGLRVAIDPQGTVAVAWHHTDHAAELRRTIVALRPPQGPVGPPQVLAEESDELHQIAADGRGWITVAWSRADAPRSADRARGFYVAERTPGAAAFAGAIRVASSTAYDSRPDLAVNRRGDALLAWGDGAVTRSPDGAWSAPQPLQMHGDTTSALNERGDGMVTSPGGALYVQYRPAGGAFGPVAQTRYEGTSFRNAAALDAFGTAVVLLWADMNSPRARLEGLLRLRDGPFRRVDATPYGTEAVGTSMATDAFGNGVVAYLDLQSDEVRAVDYSASPPRLSDVTPLPRASFRFRVSEPARVRATLWRGKRKVATLRTRAAAGVNRLRSRRVLRRGARYVARLRAFDAGRRPSRPVRVAFRAR